LHHSHTGNALTTAAFADQTENFTLTNSEIHPMQAAYPTVSRIEVDG
jgi:hypothetical protein